MSSRAMSLALAVAVLLWGGGTPAWGQEQAALPGAECSVPPPDVEPPWSAQEKWVWREICEGRWANLNQRPHGLPMPSEDEMDLPPDRVLSERFLKTILLRTPFKDVIPETGVWIVGALFKERLNLSSARIEVELFLDDSRFEAPVSFARAEFKRTTGFNGSQFEQTLDLDSIHASKSLFLRNGSQFAEVDLRSARIDGNVGMTGARFKGRLNMNSIQVGEHLFMFNVKGHQAEFAAVDLVSARVGGQVSMIGARFTGHLDMDSIQVGEHLLMDNAVFAPAKPEDPEVSTIVDLRYAKIDGQVSMGEAKFTGGLEMEGIQVGKTVLMRGAHFEKGLYLFGARISGLLQFSDAGNDATWGEGASLDLRQARLQTIEISEGSLPEETPENPRPLKLEGLQYQRIVTYAGADKVNTWNADEHEKHWLEKSAFTAHSYKQLADALEREDRPDVAAEILYASKEQQRAQADGWRLINLTLQKILIGYGYRIYQALFWFGWFVALGALFHLRIKAKPEQGLADLAASLFFSFDWLTPIVRLDETHYKDPIPGWRRYYFAAHILMGFVLVSFILAGVSGLTK